MDTGCRGHPCRSARSGPNFLRLSYVSRLGRGCGEAFAAVATQDCVEAIAEINAPRFVIGDRGAAHVAAANRPYPAHHRMTPLAVAEERVRELVQHSATQFRCRSSPCRS